MLGRYTSHKDYKALVFGELKELAENQPDQTAEHEYAVLKNAYLLP